MSEENKGMENPQEKPVDLSGLSNLQFSTAWTESSSGSRDFSKRGDRPKFGGRDGKRPDRRDNSDKKPFRKDFGEKRDFGDKKGFSDRKFDKSRPQNKFGGKDGKRFDKRKQFAPFNFSMEVLFYPDDIPFNKLVDIMKASKRTYQLFDIAELVLEKNERFILLAKNLPDETGAVKPLYCAQPLNLPFEDEHSAKAVAIEHYIDELFTKEQVDVEPPKGNFQVVNRCSVNGDLLGAPNWHRYNEYLREYHREKLAKMSFESFLTTIEAVRDEAQIAAWLESMKKRTVYKLKTPAEGENEIFDTREAAMNYVSRKMDKELVKTYDQVRMKGSNISLLPFGKIRRNIEEACRKQKRFPIVTANNLRGRLRRSGFTVYKRGSKGFAFVSVVKRKFLFEGDKLSDTPQKIFDFISANPGIIAADMPYKFLGLTPPSVKPKTKTLAEENKEGVANAVENEASATETSEISPEQKIQLSATWSELLWLVSEGYVVEYADSTLQANPYLPRPKDKNAKPHADDDVNLGAADEPIISPKEKSSEDDEREESQPQQESDSNSAESAPSEEKPSEEPQA